MAKGVGVLLTAIAAGAGAGGYFLWNRLRPGKVKPLCDGLSPKEIGYCMAYGYTLEDIADEFAMEVKDVYETVKDRLSNNFKDIEDAFIKTLEDEVMKDNKDFIAGSFIDASALMEWLGKPCIPYNFMSSCLKVNWEEDVKKVLFGENKADDREWEDDPTYLRDVEPSLAKAALKKYLKECIEEGGNQFIFTEEWFHNVWTMWENTLSQTFLGAYQLGVTCMGEDANYTEVSTNEDDNADDAAIPTDGEGEATEDGIENEDMEQEAYRAIYEEVSSNDKLRRKIVALIKRQKIFADDDVDYFPVSELAMIEQLHRLGDMSYKQAILEHFKKGDEENVPSNEGE